ncbi:hypothetical protein FBEOM_13798 [Fusarium beomiforme]|uniref:Uncharacterized protein n=1 Tax=Fusarium beomiforme TaxID=44412 RepID=A0A9P5A5P6_9HYPO|nr:hypothetical protein FBEOM_13798 [Fusarium beomiforme]
MQSGTDDRQGDALGFEANLVFSNESDTLLGIHNDARVNRSLATQEHIGKTSYNAYVQHVQYGTYQGKPACLIAIDFAFRFPPLEGSRFSSAEIEVTFEKALNIQNPSVRSTDASLDPIVANFAPKTVIGQVKELESTKLFEIEVPVVFETPFGSAGLTSRWSKETKVTEEGRMEIHGNLAQDDDHDDGANSVTWDMTENPISKEGILRSFRGALILFCRKNEAFWMRVSVKPVVKFSLDPRRLFTKRLVGDKDDPVLLDGKTPRGSLSCLGYSAFDSSAFPWHEVLNLPAPLGSRVD